MLILPKKSSRIISKRKIWMALTKTAWPYPLNKLIWTAKYGKTIGCRSCTPTLGTSATFRALRCRWLTSSRCPSSIVKWGSQEVWISNKISFIRSLGATARNRWTRWLHRLPIHMAKISEVPEMAWIKTPLARKWAQKMKSMIKQPYNKWLNSLLGAIKTFCKELEPRKHPWIPKTQIIESINT